MSSQDLTSSEHRAYRQGLPPYAWPMTAYQAHWLAMLRGALTELHAIIPGAPVPPARLVAYERAHRPPGQPGQTYAAMVVCLEGLEHRQWIKRVPMPPAIRSLMTGSGRPPLHCWTLAPRSHLPDVAALQAQHAGGSRKAKGAGGRPMLEPVDLSADVEERYATVARNKAKLAAWEAARAAAYRPPGRPRVLANAVDALTRFADRDAAQRELARLHGLGD
jgi:hypothetical protein